MSSDVITLASGVALPGSTRTLRSPRGQERVDRTPGIKAATWQGGTGSSVGMVRENRLRDYESYLNAVTISWVYQAGSTVAGAYAAADFHITDEETGDRIDKDDPQLRRLRKLLKHPNPWQTGSHFREKLCWHWELTGNVFVLKDEIDEMGVPGELYLLRPSRVRIQPDPKKYINAFFYEVNGKIKRYSPEQVVWFRRANPRDEYWGLGVIEPGEATFNKLRAIMRTVGNYFDSGARVKGVLTYDGILSEDQEAALRDDWRLFDEGQSGEFKTAVLQSGMTYQPVQSDILAHGTGMEALSKEARDEVLTLFGVPKQKIGIFEDANYRSIEADSFFQAETMLPIYRGSNEGWTEIVRCFNPTWEYKHHEKVVVDYYDKAVTAHYMAQSASFTRDEIREVSGQARMEKDDARGDEVVGPTTMTVFGVGGPMQEAALAGPGSGQTPQRATDPSPPGLVQPGHVPDHTLPTPQLGKLPTDPGTPRKKGGYLRAPCGCPVQVQVSHKGLTALDLGVCPHHARAVDEVMIEARRRRYSLDQMRYGVAKEMWRGQAFPGLAGVLGDAVVVL
jgi:HK97 family phage portal protein